MANSRPHLLAGIAIGIAATCLLVALLVGWNFRGGFTARAQPGRLEERIAGVALHASVPERYRTEINQMPMSETNLRSGMEHFADHCASCHANNGSGDTMYGRGLNPRPPDLRLAATQNKSDGELYYIIENGVRMSGMPAFGQPGAGHSHGSWNLVLFMRHLPKLSLQEELRMQGMNPITPGEMKEQHAEEEFLNGTNHQGATQP